MHAFTLFVELSATRALRLIRFFLKTMEAVHVGAVNRSTIITDMMSVFFRNSIFVKIKHIQKMTGDMHIACKQFNQ